MKIQSRIHKAMMALLRLGLWKHGDYDKRIFPLTEMEWNEVFVYSRQQTVQGLVFDGLSFLSKTDKPPVSLLAKWLIEVKKIESTNCRMDGVIDALLREWKTSSIYPKLIKGQSVARFYDQPDHRVPGDVDFCFMDKSEFCKALDWLRKNNIIFNWDSDGDIHYVLNNLIIEHHTNWYQISNPLGRRILLKYYKAEIVNEKKDSLSLPPLLDLLMINLHILKHAQLNGIGWRQICDLAVAYRAYKGKFNSSRFEQLINELHLKKWSDLLHTILVKELGMDSEFLPFQPRASVKVEQFLSQIKKEGNFGFYLSGASMNETKQFYRILRMAQRFVCKAKFYIVYAPHEMLWRPLFLIKGRLKRSLK